MPGDPYAVLEVLLRLEVRGLNEVSGLAGACPVSRFEFGSCEWMVRVWRVFVQFRGLSLGAARAGGGEARGVSILRSCS